MLDDARATQHMLSDLRTCACCAQGMKNGVPDELHELLRVWCLGDQHILDFYRHAVCWPLRKSIGWFGNIGTRCCSEAQPKKITVASNRIDFKADRTQTHSLRLFPHVFDT